MKTLSGLPSDLLTLSFIALLSGVSIQCVSKDHYSCMYVVHRGWFSPVHTKFVLQIKRFPVHNALLAKGGSLASLRISFGGFEQRSVGPPEETLR